MLVVSTWQGAFTSKNYLALAFAYGATVGALYLFGFWGTLNINILEFIGLDDLIKLAIYPLLVSMGFLVAGYFIQVVVIGDSLPPGGGENTAIGQFGRKHWRLIVALQLMVIFGVILVVKDPIKWFTAAILASMLSVVFTHAQMVIDLIPNPRARGSILFLAILVVGLAIYFGALHADRARSGRTDLIVDIKRSKLPLASEENKPVGYLGYVAGHFVLLESSSGALVFVKMKDESPIYLVPNGRRGQ